MGLPLLRLKEQRREILRELRSSEADACRGGFGCCGSDIRRRDVGLPLVRIRRSVEKLLRELRLSETGSEDGALRVLRLYPGESGNPAEVLSGVRQTADLRP